MKCFGAVIAAKGDDALWEMLEVDKDGLNSCILDKAGSCCGHRAIKWV